MDDFDPVSLREPPDLHDWGWLGLPQRLMGLFVHKSVLEVGAWRPTRRKRQVGGLQGTLDATVSYDWQLKHPYPRKASWGGGGAWRR